VFGARARVGAAIRELLIDLAVETCPAALSQQALGDALYSHLTEVGSPGRGTVCTLPEEVQVLRFDEPPSTVLRRRGDRVPACMKETVPDGSVPFSLDGQLLSQQDELPDTVVLVPAPVVASFRRLLYGVRGDELPTLFTDHPDGANWLQAWSVGAAQDDGDVEVPSPPFCNDLPFTVAAHRGQVTVTLRDGTVWATGLLIPRGDIVWPHEDPHPSVEASRLLAGFVDTLIRCQEVMFETSLLILRVPERNHAVLLPLARRSLYMTVFTAYAVTKTAPQEALALAERVGSIFADAAI
jgi:hypothetical protein